MKCLVLKNPAMFLILNTIDGALYTFRYSDSYLQYNNAIEYKRYKIGTKKINIVLFQLSFLNKASTMTTRFIFNAILKHLVLNICN